MAKKFFYNRVYNTKRTIINVVIIGACIIGVIICFIVTSNFQGENKNKNKDRNLNLTEARVEVNSTFTNEVFFSKIENVDVNDLKVTYPSNYDISKVGSYSVIIEIDGKKYNTTLIVEDTTKPVLKLKDVTINAGESYSASDFVESCEDNSKAECNIDFYKNSLDEDGNSIDYSKYTESGTYLIKIAAKDGSDNQEIQEAELIIKGKSSQIPDEPDEPKVCKYGNNEYDTNLYLLTYDITTNNCAVSLDKYKDPETAAEINKIMENEDKRIKREVDALRLQEIYDVETAELALANNLRSIVNTTGDGIVGYELSIAVKLTNGNETITIVEYKLDKDGKRVFITNPYNLSE